LGVVISEPPTGRRTSAGHAGEVIVFGAAHTLPYRTLLVFVVWLRPADHLSCDGGDGCCAIFRRSRPICTESFQYLPEFGGMRTHKKKRITLMIWRTVWPRKFLRRPVITAVSQGVPWPAPAIHAWFCLVTRSESAGLERPDLPGTQSAGNGARWSAPTRSVIPANPFSQGFHAHAQYILPPGWAEGRCAGSPSRSAWRGRRGRGGGVHFVRLPYRTDYDMSANPPRASDWSGKSPNQPAVWKAPMGIVEELAPGRDVTSRTRTWRGLRCVQPACRIPPAAVRAPMVLGTEQRGRFLGCECMAFFGVGGFADAPSIMPAGRLGQYQRRRSQSMIGEKRRR